MVRSILLVAIAALASSVHGHYVFMRVAVNGKWAEPFQYVRNHSAYYHEEHTPGGYSDNTPRTFDWWVHPTDRLESMRCNRDNMAYAKDTEVLKVTAGDQMEFASIGEEPWLWKADNFENCVEGRGTCTASNANVLPWYHPGPVVVHISRAPDGQDVRSYDGSGEWIKIYTLGLDMTGPADMPLHWLPRNGGSDNDESWLKLVGRVIFKLPEEMPKGQYLLRASHVYPAATSPEGHGEVQLYHSCAQLQVDSDATGSLPKGILIPEDFQYNTTHGMLVSQDMYHARKVDADYKYPGGPLWTGKELVEDKPAV